ncbi:RNA polymerase-binding protein DksA [Thioflexithrix psekupsensis]|uniref:RNA polymerase-binding transcription factor DksA n=1 Tax=Thioflexithrix psekupsensis TaxID=1570016 RepID=A0A251X9D6_9GAMM|nr:RNA polymerase-binding protein DksA [Thioflexithrix psekupsensis]OUD14404.1 RNA polymerase-binding protein DksA [Thioflexithrix psekupsensis]
MSEPITLPEGYQPSEEETYMNDYQLEFFRRRLLAWKNELQQEENHASELLQENDWRQADDVDRASLESDTTLELRTTERYHKLIKKIDEALERIQDGSFGYCDETGEEIGLKRLLARPIATLSIEAKERQERLEKQHRKS